MYLCTEISEKYKIMLEKIDKLMAEISALAAKSADEAEALRIKYLGKKGEITNLMNEFRNVPAEQKRELGQKLNILKTAVQNKINELKEAKASKDIEELVNKTISEVTES